MTVLVLDKDHKKVTYFWNGRSWKIGELIAELEFTREQLQRCVDVKNQSQS